MNESAATGCRDQRQPPSPDLELLMLPEALRRARFRRALSKLALGAFCALSGCMLALIITRSFTPFGWVAVSIIPVSALVAYWLYLRFPIEQALRVHKGVLHIQTRSSLGERSQTISLAGVYRVIISKPWGGRIYLRLFSTQGPRPHFISTYCASTEAFQAFAEQLRAQATGALPHYTFPFASLGLIAIMLAVHLFTALSPDVASPFGLIAAGAWVPDLLPEGHLHRLVTHAFVHISVAHLAANALALLIFGAALEGYISRATFLGVFLLGAVFSAGTSVVSDWMLLLGASGGVYSLVGFYVAARFSRGSDFRDPYPHASLSAILFLVALELVIGIVIEEIALGVHIAGLALGCACYFAAQSYGALLRWAAGAMLLVALGSRIVVGSWTDEAALKIGRHWLGTPNAQPAAAWFIATHPAVTREDLQAALQSMGPNLLDISREDTRATLHARLGDLDEAIAIQHLVLDIPDKQDDFHAAQLVRFGRARGEARMQELAAALPQQGGVVCICTRESGISLFSRVPVTWLKSVRANCAGSLEIIDVIKHTSFRPLTRLELDQQAFSLPL